MLLSRILACSTLLIATFSNSAFAVMNATRCNGCSATQYDDMARNIAQSQHAGYIYIYDLINGNYLKYHIEPEQIAGGYLYYAVGESLTGSENALWITAKTAIEANHGRSSIFQDYNAGTLPGYPDPGISVYDFAMFGSYQNNASDYFLHGPGANLALSSIGMTIASLLNNVAGIFLKSDVFALTITLAMVDHGKVELYWVAGTSRMSLVSAIDANNNPIPLTSSAIPGGYRFPHSGGDTFENYMVDRFGGQLSVSEICVNGTLACTGDGRQNYSCQWITCGGIP